MKRVIFSLLLGLFVVTLATAQEEINENVSVTYDINLSEESHDHLAAMAFEGSTMTLSYYEGKNRMVMKMMNGMIKVDVISQEDGVFTSYMDMMGQKLKVVPTDEEIENLKTEAETKGEKEITEYKEETKEILGYTCYKVIVKQHGTETILYVTDKIKISSVANLSGQGIDLVGFEGFPLETTTITNGIEVVFTATAIQDASAINFEKDETGYQEISYSELVGMAAM